MKTLLSLTLLGFILIALPSFVAAQSSTTTATTTSTSTATTTPQPSGASQGGEDIGFIPLTSIPGFADVTGANGISGFLNSLYRICIGAAAALAVIQITRAGILFMTNTGSYSSNEKAKNLIRYSLLGLLLVLSPTIVFGLIDPRILDLDLDTSRLETGSLGPTDPIGNGSQQTVSCDMDFAWVGGGTNQYAAFDELAVSGEVADGRVCCTQYGGTSATIETGATAESQEVCNLANLINQDRWVINVQAKATLFVENNNGITTEDDDRSIQIYSVGANPRNFGIINRDDVAAHGFPTNSCGNVASSPATLFSHIQANPNVGQIELQTIGGANDLVASEVKSIEQITDINCTKVNYRQD